MNRAILPDKLAAWALAARLSDVESLQTWRVLIVRTGAEEEVSEHMRELLASLSDAPVTHHRVSSVEDLIHAATRDPHELLVLSGLDGFDEPMWRALDINRSRVLRDAPTLLVVAEGVVANMPALAPNLWSFIGDAVWRYDPDIGLTSAERELRLAELRQHFGFDDAELLRRAAAGQLHGEPDIAEWLVLIGEGTRIPGEVAR